MDVCNVFEVFLSKSFSDARQYIDRNAYDQLVRK